MDAGVQEGADGRERLRLGEDLGVRPDADLEILAPGALRDEHLLEARGLARARLEPGEILADEAHDLGADGGRGLRVAARPLLDHALEHRDGEGDARRLDRLQVDGGEEPGLFGVASLGRRVGEDRRKLAERLALGLAQLQGWVLILAEIAHRREARRDVDDAVRADGDDRRSAELGSPDAPGERGVAPILGKAVLGGGGEIKRHVVVPGFVGRFSFSGGARNSGSTHQTSACRRPLHPLGEGKADGQAAQHAHGEEGEALGLDRVAAP